MKWFKDLKIKSKLLLSFGGLIVLAVLVFGISFFSLSKTDTDYTHMLEYNNKRLSNVIETDVNISNTRRIVVTIAMNSGLTDEISSLKKQLETIHQKSVDGFAEYNKLVETDTYLTEDQMRERVSVMDELADVYDGYYYDVALKVLDNASQGYQTAAMKIISDSQPAIQNMVDKKDSLKKITEDTMNKASDELSESTLQTEIMLIVIMALILLVSALLATVVSNIISKPLNSLVGIANDISKGNLNVNIVNDYKDETGMLSVGFSNVVRTINSIVSDIDTMYKHHEDGDIHYRIDDTKYEGSYREVAYGINQMVQSYIHMLDDIFRVLQSYAKGDFTDKLKKYEGEKAIANTQMRAFREAIANIVSDIDVIAVAGGEGKLSTRADVTKYEGSWKQILQGLNKVLDSVVEPVNEAQEVLVEMSKGNLNASVNGDYKGDFAVIKHTLNNTMTTVAGYINEITKNLDALANGDLTVSISREYVGQFELIKKAINQITESLVQTVSGISSSSDQVLAGAKQISDSAMGLAEGTSEQAASIQQLTSTIESINSQTKNNAENADSARDLSGKSTENAESGNAEMKKMLESMDGIKDSSNNISQIIKTIEDIAFQTNLLALNAAVEAARAGQHGKGFAVVAEEVRSLASRSQNAARETTAMIESSISKVNEGTAIARQTAAALSTIVENVRGVSDIISSIAQSSNDQATAISQVNIGLTQIAQVVQNNSSTSEESAAAAEELNSQAELLTEMVSYFKLP